MQTGATLTGGADLSARLMAMPSAVAWKVQRDALLAGAEPIRAEAQLRVKRRTGELAVNIIVDALSQHEVEQSVDFTGDEAVVEVGANVPHFYGYFLEYGTVTMAAQPFMRPAVDAMAGRALNIALAHLWASIRALGTGGALSLPANVGAVGSRNL